eukprot:753676-Hanusia_phi.AAC.8
MQGSGTRVMRHPTLELGPGEDVVEVVLELVVLGQARQVAGLHLQQVLHPCPPNVHHALVRLTSFTRKMVVG